MTEKKSRDQRTEEIVNAAVEEFLGKGYERASMENIAKRAGLSKGGLYHYFKSKDEILIYATKKLSDPVVEIFIKAASGQSMEEALKVYIDEYIHFWYDNRKSLIFYFISMIKVFQDKSLSVILWDYGEQLFPFVEGFFQRGIKQGEFRPHDTVNRARALQSAMDGMRAYLLLDEKLKPEEVIKGFQIIFINNILIKK